MQSFDPKWPSMILNLGIDFTRSLAPGETLVAGSAAAVIIDGSCTVSGAALGSGSSSTIVGFTISGGVSGDTSIISTTISTSTGELLEERATIACY